MGIHQLARVPPGDAVRDGVHREIAPSEIIRERPGRHLGERTGVRVRLPPRTDHVHVPPVCELEARRAEAVIHHHACPHHTAHHPRERDRVALNHQVDVHAVAHPEERVPHRTADKRNNRSAVRHREPAKDGILRNPVAHRASIEDVADHVSGNLSASAPIALDGLTDAIARWEGASLDELRTASDRITGEFRTWIDDPVNAGRPISEAPVYLDRMAVELLIERRYFSE